MASIFTVLGLPIPVNAQTNPATTVYLDPATIDGTLIGQVFTVDIMISDAVNVRSWTAGLTFNATLLECLDFEEGEFLRSVGPTSLTAGTIDNVAGVISPPYTCSFMGTYTASGSGRLAYLIFRVKETGVSDLHFRDVSVRKMEDWVIKMVPINIIDVYTVLVYAAPYKVVTVSNTSGSTVHYHSGFYGHAFSTPDKELSFNVTGPYWGFANVTIPKTLLWVDALDEWTVSIDGILVSRTATENGTHTSIYFTYAIGIHRIRIIGTRVIGPVRNLNTGISYDTVQEAIDAPETLDGHTIFVKAGTYYEHVVVNKSVSLVGESKDNVIIDGNGTGRVLEVVASNVTLSSFKIKNSGGSWDATGIYLSYSNNIIIEDIYFGPITYVAVDLFHSNKSDIMRNTISVDYIGVHLLYSYENNIIDNTIEGTDYGIDIIYSGNIKVSSNNVTQNYVGISIWNSSVTITQNTLKSNSYGIWVTRSVGGYIYHNNFLDSGVHNVNSTNTWDDGYPSGGNYWSDHVCVGNPSNGSQPYIIDADNIDHYPFQDLNGWLLPPPVHVFEVVWDSEVFYVSVESNSTISNFYFNQSRKEIGFNVTGVDGTVGFCNVTIPKTLLQACPIEQWIVLIDAHLPLYLIAKENATHTMLYFTYSHTTHQVQIFGTWVIGLPPEYTLTIYSSPVGVTFTVDDVSHTTLWSETYIEGTSVSLVMPETHTDGDARYYWNQWSDAVTSRSRTLTMNTNITLTAHYTGPYYQLTVTSSPITGITFTIDGAPQATPYTEWLLEGSYTLEMPETCDGYVWSHWLEDGDTDTIKTIILPGTTWTAVYAPARPPPPVGGEAVPINTPVNKPELPALWIWLLLIILPLVATLVFVKLGKERNKN